MSIRARLNFDYQSVNRGESNRATWAGVQAPQSRRRDTILMNFAGRKKFTSTRISFPGGVILRSTKLASFCVAIAILGLIPLLSAQPAEGPAPGPVPPQNPGSPKVVLSNGGGRNFENVIDQTVFNGGPDRPYNQF